MKCKDNSLLFFVKYHSKFPFIQELILIIEYLPLFLSGIACPGKFSFYLLNTLKAFTKSTLFDLIIPFNLSSRIGDIIVLIILFILQLFYAIMGRFVINKEYSKSLKINCLFRTYSMFYDTFFFRFGSFYILSLYSNIMFILSISISPSNILLTTITFTLMLWYVIQLFKHIQCICVMFHLTNTKITNGILNYPYDWNFSRLFDTNMIVLKLLISIENGYYKNSIYINNSIMVSLNGIVVLYILGYFLYMLYNTIFLIRFDWFVFNRELIFLRIGLLFLMGYTILIIFCFLNANSSNGLIIFIIFIGFIWTSATLLFIWVYRILPHLYNGTISFKKLLLIIMGINSSLFIKIDQSYLISSFELNFKNSKVQNAPNRNTPTIQEENYLIYVFIILNYYTKESECIIEDDIDIIYCNILKLLQYYFKGKLFKYFSYYNSLIRKYGHKKTIVNNIHLLVKTSLTSFDESIAFYSDILSDSILNQKIKTILDSLSSLFTLHREIIKPKSLFKIAGNIAALKVNSKYLMTDADNIVDKSPNDIPLKNLRQSYKYFIIIHRYIVESILNESICHGNLFDIEGMEDFLSLHYLNDKTLLLSLNINALTANKEELPCTILECGKDLIKFKNKNISHVFPKHFRRECVKALSIKLLHYFENTISESSCDIRNNLFENLFTSSTPLHVELFRYHFKIIPSIINNDVLINGIYSAKDINIIVFNTTEEGDLVLETFSSSLNDFFIITPEWIQYTRTLGLDLTMKVLFAKISNINSNDYECDLDYYKLYSLYSTYSYYDNDYEKFTKKNYLEIKEKLKANKGKINKPIHFQLHFLFEIEKKSNYKIFSIIGTKSAKTIQNSFDTQDNDQNELYDLIPGHLVNSTNISKISSVIPSLSKEIKKCNYGSNKVFKVDQISKKFTWFSSLIFLFNCVMIGICLFFLAILIYQSQKLSAVNKIYYKFQTIRITFANTFLNVFSNVCVAKINSNECNNAYKDYSEELHNLQNLDPKHSIRALIVNAIKYKINGLQTQYNDYKEKIYKFGNKQLEKILNTEMIYISIGVENKRLTQEIISITLEEGIRKFINSLAVLDSPNDGFDSEEYPIHIISLKEQHIDFTNVYDHDINDVQREIYKVCINFINYSSGYLNGEQLLLGEFLKIVKSNKMILYSYIALITSLHFFLAILCLWIIAIVKNLLVSFLIEISFIITDKKIKEYFITKLDSLKQLNDLYIKNPNYLINHIKKAKRDVLKHQALENKNHNSIINKNRRISLKFQEENLITEPKESQTIDQSEIKAILFPLVIQIYALFGSYFLCTIIFNVFLLKFFERIILTNDYVSSNVNLENQIYNNVALPQVITLLNLTQEELASGLGEKDVSSDGVLNMKFRQANKYKEDFFRLENEYPSLFPPISSYFGNKCELIFEKTRDKITTLLGELLGVDYIPFQIEMCYRYKSLSLPNFEYNYIDHNFRSQQMQRYFRTYSYEDLYDFNQKFEFFDLYTFTLIAVRPIRAYITDQILYNLIDSALSNFISIISGYLCFNIIGDVSMFLIIQIFIIKKMNSMHQNLQNFGKCFNVDNTTP